MVKRDNNKHSVFLLYYHLVLVTKYRRTVINDEISEYAKNMFLKIASNYNITLVEWNYEEDHIQILFKGQLKTELTKFINAYKSVSSRLIKKNSQKLERNYGRRCFIQEVFAYFQIGV